MYTNSYLLAGRAICSPRLFGGGPRWFDWGLAAWWIAALLLATQPAVQAAERLSRDGDSTNESTDGEPSAGKQWALIICGLPGDDEHRAMYAESVEQLTAALVGRLGFARDCIRVQFAGEPTENDGPAIRSSRGKASCEELEGELADLRRQLRQQDSLWTIVLGHGHYDGRNAYLNLPGRDLHQGDFAKLFAGVRAQRQVFMITTSVSGFFIRPLSGKNRVVITATEADFEVNETLFHAALAEVLTEPPAEADLDVDGSGNITLFDLYIAVTKNVAQRYLSEMLLATEHALLDDNGDGRGTELHLDYLSEEEGGRGGSGRPPRIRENSDGALAKRIRLRWSDERPASTPASRP